MNTMFLAQKQEVQTNETNKIRVLKLCMSTVSEIYSVYF